MTDYEIQKATAAKVGVVSPPDNIYGCRKSILEKLGGDSTDADTIYECDKRILPLIGGGSSNLQEKSVTITENGTTSVVPDEGYSLSKVDVNVNVPPTPIQEKSVNITENGTTSIEPDSGYNLSKANVNVKVRLKLANGTKLSSSTFTVLPDYDFSDITDMREMFYECTNLTSVPDMNTSNVTNMYTMFRGCLNLTSIPPIDTSNVTSMNGMFDSCEELISVPLLNASKVEGDMDSFFDCNKLTDLGGFTNLGKAFRSAKTLNISSSPLTNQSVQNIIDTVYDMNLNTTGGSATLKLKQTVINSMTDEQKSQLSAKGWTLTN